MSAFFSKISRAKNIRFKRGYRTVSRRGSPRLCVPSAFWPASWRLPALLSRRRRRLVAFRRQRRRLVSLFTVSYRNYRAPGRRSNRRNRPCPSSTKIYGRASRTGETEACARETVDVSPRVPQRSIRARTPRSRRNKYTRVCMYTFEKNIFSIDSDRASSSSPALHLPCRFSRPNNTAQETHAYAVLFFFCPVCFPTAAKKCTGKNHIPAACNALLYVYGRIHYNFTLHLFIWKRDVAPCFFFARALSRRPPPPPPLRRRAVPGRTPFGRRHTLYAKKKNKTKHVNGRSGLSVVLRIIT